MAIDAHPRTRQISATEARTQLGEVLDSVETTGQDVIIERDGQQVAVAVSIEDYRNSIGGTLPQEWWEARNQLAAAFRRNAGGKRMPNIKEMIDEAREDLG